MKTFATVLLSLFVLLGQDQFVGVPITNPFGSFSSAPIEEASIAGKLIGTIRNGDFVHPTFSPDGSTLAYARVLTPKSAENTEILLHRLSNRQTSILLTQAQAWKYATYQASVSDMVWKTPGRLEVEIHDGDVDATRLIINPTSGRLIREEFGEGSDELPIPPLPEPFQEARKQALSVFPELPANVMDHALRASAFLVPDRGVILQKNYPGHDSNVWFIDFKKKSMEPLVILSEPFINALGGAVTFGSSTIILLFDKSYVYLFEYKEEKIKSLARITRSSYPSIEVKYRSPGRVIFQVKVHAPYDRGDNPLFVFDGTLRRVKEYQELYDVDVDREGKRIAFCYWASGKRKIAIKELK